MLTKIHLIVGSRRIFYIGFETKKIKAIGQSKTELLILLYINNIINIYIYIIYSIRSWESPFSLPPHPLASFYKL